MEFEDYTVSITLYNCTGTISYNPSPFKVRISKDQKFLWISGSRVTISNFHRTGANPGIQMNIGIPRDETYVFDCGFRMDATTMRPESVYGWLSTSGALSFRTTESYTNASGNPLHLFINSCIIPLE